MLQRLIRGFHKIAASRCMSVEGQIRLSHQRDVPGQPYAFEVDFFDGDLSGSFFIGVDGIGEEEHIRIPYALGTPSPLDFTKTLLQTEFKQSQEVPEGTRMAGAGQAFTRVVVVAKTGFRNLGRVFSQRGICYILGLAPLLNSAIDAAVICLTRSHFSLKYNGCASCVHFCPFRQC